MSHTFASENDLWRETEADIPESVPYSSDTDEDIPEVALSVVWQGNKLGAAYYDFDTEHMYLMPDHSETASFFTILNLLLKQIQPHCIITTCKSDEKFVKVLNDACTKRNPVATGQTSNGSSERCSVLLLPNIDFAYASSRHHLENLVLPTLPQNVNSVERKIFFLSLIDFTCTCMVKAAGGLLKFIGKKSLNLNHERSQLTVQEISNFSPKNIVHIDENTYRALQIFQDEKHPSVYKNASGVKEGLSLYGICNKCTSGIGRKELRFWFLLPTKELSIIEERHTAVRYLSLPKNIEIVNALQSSLKHIKYLPTSYHAMIIAEICHSHSSSLPIFKKISEACSTDVYRVASLLDKVIDFEEYTQQNHFAVKPGIDHEIDKMKQIYNGLPDFMTQVAHQELKELHADIVQCSVIYLPQLGYLLAIPITEHMKESKDYVLPNLKYMFVLNNTVHYKSASTRTVPQRPSSSA